MKEEAKNARASSEILETEKALSATLQERDSLVSLLEGLCVEIGTVPILVQLGSARCAGMGIGGSFRSQFGRAFVEEWDLFQQFLIGLAYLWWLWVGAALFIYLLSLSGIGAVRVLRSHLLHLRRLGNGFLFERGGLRKGWGLSCCGNSRGFRRGR